MRQSIHYRRMARAALNTAAHAESEQTAAQLRLMAADYAAQADREEAIENSNDGAGAPPFIDVLAQQAAQNIADENER